MTLGKRIKRARERLRPKLRQKDIGDAFNISDKAVSAWERDDTVPEPAKLPKLARILQVPLDWLLDGGAEPPAHDDIHARLEGLTSAERAVVSDVIDSLHKRRGQVA